MWSGALFSFSPSFRSEAKVDAGCDCRTSSVPVWSDTLLPEAPSLAMVIKSVHKANSLSPERLLQGKQASEAEAARASQEARKSAPSKDHPKPKPSQRKFNPVPIPRRKPAVKVVERGVCPKAEKDTNLVPSASDSYSTQLYKQEGHTTEVVDGLVPSRSMSVQEIHGHPMVKKEESPGFVGGDLLGSGSNDVPRLTSEDDPRFASEDVVSQTLLHLERPDSHYPTPIPDNRNSKDLRWEEVSTVWEELDTVALAFIDRFVTHSYPRQISDLTTGTSGHSTLIDQS